MSSTTAKLKKKINPKPGYDKVALQQILLDPKNCPLNSKGRILPPSDEIFRTISRLMENNGSKITPKHIHTIINNNRNGFKDYILEKCSIQEQDLTPCDNDDLSITACTSNESTDTQRTLVTREMNLVISSEKWRAIRPQEKMYGKRV